MRKLPNVKALLVLAVLGFSPGCASIGKSVGAGAGIGGAIGAGVGAIADPGPEGSNRIRNVLIGTAVGGAVGAGAGYLADRYVQGRKNEAAEKGKRDAQKEIADQSTESGGKLPRLIPAKTEARWVPDQVRGSTFIPGHFEYFILETARWEINR